MSCSHPGCELPGKFTCSRCKTARYCSSEHQKLEWPTHKTSCHKLVQNSLSSIDSTASQSKPSSEASNSASSNSEQRECRCMFCGEMLLLSSEDEAVNHMRVCPLLQEQFQGEGQFTIPKSIRDKVDMSQFSM